MLNDLKYLYMARKRKTKKRSKKNSRKIERLCEETSELFHN